jgi:hypothetical protein
MFKKWFNKEATRKGIIAFASVALVLMLLFYAVPNIISRTANIVKSELTMGSAVQAAGIADATCDGAADDVQALALVTALPATGGRIYILTGTYVWTNATTVTRAVPNVTIEGTGAGTYLTGDTATAQFTAGGNGWTLKNFRVDVTAATLATAMGATTGWSWENITTSDGYFAYRTDDGTGGDHWEIPTGRGATYVVAASDATATAKAQADYVCDGTADEVQINAAINLLIDNTTTIGGGSIHLTEGTFYIAAPITFSKTYRDFLVNFSGSGTRTELRATNDNDIIHIGSAAVPCAEIYVSAMWLNGSKSTEAAGNGIVVYGWNCSFSDMTIWDTVSAGLVLMDDTAHTSGRNKVDNVLICNSSLGGTYGLAIYDTNSFISNTEVHAYASGGIYLYNNDAQAGKYTKFSNVWSSENNYGVVVEGAISFTSFLNCNVTYNIKNGYVFKTTATQAPWVNLIIGGTIDSNSAEGAGTYSAIKLDASAGSSIYYIDVVGTMFGSTIYNHKYLVEGIGTVNNVQLLGCNIPNTPAIAYTSGVTNVVAHDNLGASLTLGSIAPGEVRTAFGSLTGGAQNAILFSWHNPEAQDIYIKKVVVTITTADADAANIDIGIADDATYTNGGTEFFNDLTGETILVYDSWIAGDLGTQLKWLLVQDSASATDGWVVAKILDADGTSIVGSYYIEFCGK